MFNLSLIKEARLNNGEKKVSSINGVGITVKKNVIRTFFNTIHKNKLKMDKLKKEGKLKNKLKKT